MSTELSETQVIQRALDVVSNPLIPIEDKGAAWAILWRIQNRIRKAIGVGQRGMTIQHEIIAHMEANHLKAMGPLSVKASAIDPHYPVNDEENWGDAGTQEELELLTKVAPDFIRRVPEHFEIRTAELGSAVHDGDPVAIQLWTMCKERRWRVEDGKRLSLAVSEAKPPREKAA
jgi:hypothetical protein